jgi:hypothetical protein
MGALDIRECRRGLGRKEHELHLALIAGAVQLAAEATGFSFPPPRWFAKLYPNLEVTADARAPRQPCLYGFNPPATELPPAHYTASHCVGSA